MAQFKASITTRLALIAVLILTATQAVADKPSWAGGDKHEGHGQKERHDHDKGQGNDDDNRHYDDNHDRDKPTFSGGKYFADPHRTVIRDYYANEIRVGHCPPGLFKKHNGCMPPGQAKKWVMGRPLPRNVIFYDLPPEVLTNIGSPPPGYRFVRVASDILMITTGTGTVMDAINYLGGGY